MRVLFIVLVICSIGFGYGYWDLFSDGSRVNFLSPASTALAGATIPTGSSALSMFTNPSGLAGLEGTLISINGWGTGWREEIYYNMWCDDPSRFNKGGMTPRGVFAAAFPLGKGFSAGLGIGTVAQYEMRGTVQVYHNQWGNRYILWKTLISQGSGDQHEALLSLAGSAGPVMIGVSPGVRFGSGDVTTYSNRTSGGTQLDSTFSCSWKVAEFALRAGVSMDMGYTRLYTSYASGGERYKSQASIGAAASFPFLQGGFLGTELALLEGDELRVAAYTRLPWAFPGSNVFMGVSGYRPDNAYKMGMGVSGGVDYAFGGNRLTGAFSWNTRYRENTAVDISCINWVYDSGHSVSLGYDRAF